MRETTIQPILRNISATIPFRYVCLLVLLLAANGGLAAYLEDVPVTLQQPDSSFIECYMAGDEFYNWLYDRDHFTIIKDPQSGYYVYAQLENGELAPTRYVVGRDRPEAAGLVPRLNIQPVEIRRLRENSLISSSAPLAEQHPAPKSGIIENLVIYIRFADDPEFTDKRSMYEKSFNDETPGAVSVRNYFQEISYGALSVHTLFFPATSGETVISFRDSYSRGYYKPIADHPLGYSSDSEKASREQALLKRALESIRDQVPVSLELDGDDDGRVDNVIFVIYGSPTAWNTLLWPHAWSLYMYDVTIRGKRVYGYNLQMQSFVNYGQIHIICHELLHTVGFPDLYHYTSDGIQSVAGWDIMASPSSPPQHPGGYTKWKYGKWISSLPVAKSNGVYTLNPLTDPQGNLYKIPSPNDPSGGQFFVVEYRRRRGTFESSLPGEGLLVYRIDVRDAYREGNAVPPDEVYLYRPGGTPTSNGASSRAAMSLGAGRIALNDFTDPACYLADGGPGGLDLFNVGALGETITFSLGGPLPPAPSLQWPADLSTRIILHPTLEWKSVAGASSYQITVATNPDFTDPVFQSDHVAGPSVSLSNLSENTAYYWRIAAKNQSGCGPWSEIWRFSTLDLPPAAPLNIAAQPCFVCR